MLVVVLAILATIFATDNMHRVQIGFVVGPPLHMRLFFVIMTAFMTGFFIAVILNMYWRVIARKTREKKTGGNPEEDQFF